MQISPNYQKKIIHIDMDAFFASVEMRDFPQYRNIPLAVGGNEKQRGVISTCNYEARRYGVRSAMSTAISQCQQHHGSATLIAEAIREEIRTELNLTASAGVTPIKFLTKIASDMNKPDGQFVITPSQVQSVVDQLPLGKIPGVGKVSLEKLNNAGFYVCSDIRNADYLSLVRRFGRLGDSLWNRSHGIDPREVTPHRQRKSVGVERTFASNISSYEECWQVIEQRLYPEMQKRLGYYSKDNSISKQGIKVKFADFQLTSIEHVHQSLDLEYFRDLLEQVLKRQNGREIRLLGLSVMLKSEEEARQLPLDFSNRNSLNE